jgi:hypothetical protein
VAAKIRPGDWDRLFAPNAPRRGGPLRALVNVLLTFLTIALIGAGSIYAVNYRNQQIASQTATQQAIAPTLIAQATARAAEATATVQARAAARTATAVAKQPTPEASLGVGMVVANGGNLREQPGVTSKAIGLIFPGDEVTFLAEELVGGQTWFRIRLVKPAPNRAGDGVAPGTEGWAVGQILSQPTPVAPQS